MLDTVAKKKKKDGEDRHLNPRFGFYVEQPLLDALSRYCDDQQYTPDKSEVLRVILRDFLERQGYWPLKEE